MPATKSASKKATAENKKGSTSEKVTEGAASAANKANASEDVQKVQVVPPGPEGGEIAPTGTEPSVPDKTSLNSAVTTDLKNDEGAAEASERAQAEADERQAEDTSVEARAARAGIGLVKVDGIDFRYIGVAPARMGGKAKTPTGLAVTPENSTFTPLASVPFHPSIRCQNGETGEYYYPKDTDRSWDAVEFEGRKLVPAE